MELQDSIALHMNHLQLQLRQRDVQLAAQAAAPNGRTGAVAGAGVGSDRRFPGPGRLGLPPGPSKAPSQPSQAKLGSPTSQPPPSQVLAASQGQGKRPALADVIESECEEKSGAIVPGPGPGPGAGGPPFKGAVVSPSKKPRLSRAQKVAERLKEEKSKKDAYLESLCE